MKIQMQYKGKRHKWIQGHFSVLFVAASVVLAACGSSSSSSAASSSSSTSGKSTTSHKPYVLHAILSETGQGSFLGAREAKALKGLTAQVNASGGIDGHPIQLSIQNNQSSPVTAVSLASSLISSGVQLILNGSI